MSKVPDTPHLNAGYEQEIRSLVAKVIKKPESAILPEADLFADLGVDSLLGVEIFAALDKKYHIDIPENKIGEIKTLSDIIVLVEKYRK